MNVVTGHQPVYLPWLGLFHKIALADAFVFMDDVQYLQQDWNNRNRIKGSHGPFRLTVPVRRGSSHRTMREVRIDHDGWSTADHWQRRHWRSLESSYRRAPFWGDHAAFFETLYTRKPWRWLVDVNERVLRYLLGVLDLNPRWITATQFGFTGGKSDLVLDHCRRLGGDVCVLGAHGRDYIVEEDFAREGIGVYHQDYRHPGYPQRFGEFCSHLSVVDLLFNCGPSSREVLLSGNDDRNVLDTLVCVETTS